jgi:hypothetical protein
MCLSFFSLSSSSFSPYLCTLIPSSFLSSDSSFFFKELFFSSSLYFASFRFHRITIPHPLRTYYFLGASREEAVAVVAVAVAAPAETE